MFLHFQHSTRSKDGVHFVESNGEKCPLSDIRDKEYFVYGKGWQKVEKKKIHKAEALPENYNANDLLESFKKYDADITLRLIDPRYSPNDCVYHYFMSELIQCIRFGSEYDKMLLLVNNLDNKCKSILQEKYGMEISDIFITIGEDDTYEIISTYTRNSRTGKLDSQRSTRHHFFSGNISMKELFYTPDAQYCSISHEINLDTMIRCLANRFEIIKNKKFNEASEDELSNILDEISVNDKIKAIYGDEVAEIASELNDMKMEYTEYFQTIMNREKKYVQI